MIVIGVGQTKLVKVASQFQPSSVSVSTQIESTKMLSRFSVFATVGVLADPMVQVALAPAEGAGADLTQFTNAENKAETAGLQNIQSAMTAALASAQGQINAAVHGSFLQQRGGDVFIRVADGPQSLASGRADRLESMRNSMENKSIAQAAGEFDALTKVVVNELRRSLHGSFLGSADSLDVKVKASDIPWPSTMAALRGTEASRDASEAALDAKILDMQRSYVGKLNDMIAQALA
jgi:hypothetical protein